MIDYVKKSLFFSLHRNFYEYMYFFKIYFDHLNNVTFFRTKKIMIMIIIKVVQWHFIKIEF